MVLTALICWFFKGGTLSVLFPLPRTMYSYNLYGNSTNGNVITFTIGLQLCIKILSAIPFTGQLFIPSRRCPDGVINDTDYSASCTLSSLHYAPSAQALCWPPDPFSARSLAGLTGTLVNRTKRGTVSHQNGWSHNPGGKVGSICWIHVNCSGVY